MNRRFDGRLPDELRPLSFELGVNVHAEGSCIVTMGRTRVWCTASVNEDVPRWLRDSGKGWVTAEYRMLPRATNTRSEREGRNDKKGRTAEIERLIARALRASVDLAALGPRQITIDCDVLQADGGTRCASVNGGYVALVLALRGLVAAGKLRALPLRHSVAAISVGLVDGQVVADLPYEEDSTAQVDANLVMTGTGLLVEVQGTAEGEPFPESELHAMLTVGRAAIADITAAQLAALG